LVRKIGGTKTPGEKEKSGMILRAKNLAVWVGSVALSMAMLFGYKCPIHGCPACKIVGK